MAEADKEYKFPFKVNDRVQRSKKEADSEAKREGCLGTVVSVQEETSPAGGHTNSHSLLITVLWDNGSQSALGVDGLAAV